MNKMTFSEMRETLERLRSKPYRDFNIDDIPAIEISTPELLPSAPLVSVVMITYNHQKFIRQALDSALSQKLSAPYEIIIGEDCSTDDTRSIVLEYQRKYPEKIRLVVSDRNVGASQNLIRILSRAKGQFIAFLEGDDFWQADNKLALQAEFLLAHPEYAVVYSDSDIYFMKNGITEHSILKTRGFLENARQMKVEDNIIYGRFWFNTCTSFGRSKILLPLRNNPLFSMELMLGDLILYLEYGSRGQQWVLEPSLATYRINLSGTSASTLSDPRKQADLILDSLLIVYYYVNQYKYPEKLFSSTLARLLPLASKKYQPDWIEKIRNFIAAIQYRPTWTERLHLRCGENRFFHMGYKMYKHIRK